MILESYKGNLGLIKSLQNLIESKYEDLFLAVIVHGSVATNEVIPYSDFDGLLIVKTNMIDSQKLKDFKIESMKYIYKFDPLQHHGWFQINENQLLDYPEYYLPLAVLEKSKGIYPVSKDIDLNIQMNNQPDYLIGLFKMINQLEQKAITKWKPKNMFQLKSFLSQIMLVPCLFYSAKYKEGIFKKESFHAVKATFNQSEWLVIERASQIRNEWHPQLNYFQKKVLQIPIRLVRKAVVRFMPIHIPKQHQKLMNDEFYNSIILLVAKIKTEIS